VTFRNPAWTEWVKNKVIPDVCEVLGVGLAATNPKVELYKLLVYETGSQYALSSFNEAPTDNLA
jgi:hypothetical protein